MDKSIAKLKKIRNLGSLFSTYSWDSSLPSFKRFNLIYGWNGSGKTTLSRLFEALGGKEIDSVEYEIEDESGAVFGKSDVYPKPIRVFNQDYIRENLQLVDSRTKVISILLGKENRELAEQIRNDRILLDGDVTDSKKPGLQSLRNQLTKEKGDKEKSRGQLFTEIAKTIGAAIGGSALRTYRKPQAVNDFEALSVKDELSEIDLNKFSQSVKQESLQNVDPVALELYLNVVYERIRQRSCLV